MYIRASRLYAEMQFQQNMHAILNGLPNGGCYTVNNNNRVIRREYDYSQNNMYRSNVVSGNNSNWSQNNENNNFRKMGKDNYQNNH